MDSRKGLYRLSPVEKGRSKAAHMQPRVRVQDAKDSKRIDDAAVLKSAKYPKGSFMRKSSFKRGLPAKYIRSRLGSAAKPLGTNGNNSFVFKVDVANPQNRHNVQNLLRGLSNQVEASAPLPAAGAVLIKVNLPDRSSTWLHYIKSSLHEAGVHSYLANPTRCTELHCGTKVCTAPVVPKLYGAGADTAEGVFVTVMELVQGPTLNTYLKDRNQKLDAKTFVLIEKAIASLWMAGVAHADFHSSNVIITPTGQVKIIDFGMAVVLPKERRQKVRSILARVPHIGGTLANAAWYARNTLDDYVETIMATRYHKLPFFNPDGKQLRALFNKVSAKDRMLIPRLRAAAWGCSGTPKSGSVSFGGVSHPSATYFSFAPKTPVQQGIVTHHQGLPPGIANIPGMTPPQHSPCGLDEHFAAGKCIKIGESIYNRLRPSLQAIGNPMHGLTHLWFGKRA